MLKRMKRGVWHWSWNDRYPEAWAQDRDDWQGQIKVANLGKLRTIGRIRGGRP